MDLPGSVGINRCKRLVHKRFLIPTSSDPNIHADENIKRRDMIRRSRDKLITTRHCWYRRKSNRRCSNVTYRGIPVVGRKSISKNCLSVCFEGTVLVPYSPVSPHRTLGC